ncbi:gLUG domain-containing protein [Bacteroides sp. CAG:1060]|nr:gLUG domain-containing protein [Bacteroides sp. CAG:1060]
MKRYFKTITAVVLAALATAACQKENFGDATPAGQEVDVTLDLLAPQIGTKSYGDGTTAKTVYVHVYQQDADGNLTYIEPAAEGASLKTPSQSLTLNGLKATYSTRLVTGQTYTFVFWAQADKAPYTYDTDAKTITVNYASAKGNDESRDAFYNVLPNVKIEGAYTASVQLARPFAQLNFGAADYEEAKVAGLTVTDATVTLTHAATSLNLLKGTTTGDETVTFASAALPADPNAILTAGGKDYKYVAMDYVLVGKSAKTLSDVTLTLTATGTQSATPEFTYSNVPLQANYRTNIVGNLFTSPAEVQIEITPGFGTPDNIVGTLSSANEAFAAGVTTVTVNEITSSDPDVIVLPKTTETVTINLPAAPAGKSITIRYADSATESEKPQTLTVNATSAENLIIEAPTTHVELNGVTVKTVTASTSSTTLVVGKDVKIGTLKLEQGAAEIYGNVSKVVKGENAGTVTWYVDDAANFETALNNADKVVLTANIDLVKTASLKSGKTVVLDANGKTIYNTSDLWDKPTERDNNWSLVSVKGGKLTITGNGTFAAKKNDCYPVDVQDKESAVTIENGVFVGNIHAVYVESGVAYVNGGKYSVQQKYSVESKADGFVLNCYDANRVNGTAKILVSGGEFANFNPGDCWAEGAHTNFVAEGYASVTASANPFTYKVVKATKAEDAASIDERLNKKETVVVAQSFELNYETKVSAYKSATLKLEGGVITTDNFPGKNITDAISVAQSAVLNIEGNGTINGPVKSGRSTSALAVRGRAKLNIYGNLVIDGGSSSAGNNAIKLVQGTANIFGGYFHSGNDAEGKASEVIYLECGAYTTYMSTLNIYGGVFECDGDASHLINCYDAAYRVGNAKVNIYGGTFVGFNPADNTAEGEHTNFVAEGYKSVETTYNGKQAWTVVAE